MLSYPAVAPVTTMWTTHANVIANVVFQPLGFEFTSAGPFHDSLILGSFSARTHAMIGDTVFHDFFDSHSVIYGSASSDADSRFTATLRVAKNLLAALQN